MTVQENPWIFNQKLLSMDQEIANLKAMINVAKGILTVYINDGTNLIPAKRGSVIELFAGYYDELLDLTNTSNYGKIVSTQYTIELRNETASKLELASIIPERSKCDSFGKYRS